MSASREQIDRLVREAQSTLPASVADLDRGTLALVRWHARRAGVTPEAYLTEARFQREKKAALDERVSWVLAAVRR